jgi:putative spermidine/putrescine transport system substrate-binding protein
MMTGALRASGCLLVFLAVAGITTDARARERLVVAIWGGFWGDSVEKNVLKPFRAANDVEVVVLTTPSSASAMTKIIAEKKNPTIDIWFTAPPEAHAVAKEGVGEALTTADVPELQNFADAMLGKLDDKIQWVDYGIKNIGLVIRSDLVKLPPKPSFDWLADPSLKGLVALPPPYWVYSIFLNQAAMAKTGDMTDLNAGFDVAKKIAPNVRTIYGTTGEAVRLLTTGEVAVVYGTATTATNLMTSKVANIEFRPVADAPLFVNAETVMAIKGGPGGKALASRFLNFFLSPKILAAYTEDVGISSGNRASPPASKEKVPFPSTAEELEKGNRASQDKNLDAINARWKAEVAPLLGSR